MDYYERRSRALRTIAELLKKKATKRKIYLAIGVEFGLGPKCIDTMIEIVEAVPS